MKRILLTSFLAGAIALTTSAQVNQRRQDQQDRIANGVHSGQLTPGETSHLENRERAVNGEVRADRSANGGTLTSAERARVNRQQNSLSRQIHTDKTNASKDHFGNSEVGGRQRAQQQRIAQGIRSGSLKAGETANLEAKSAGVNREVHADRAANGGRLSTSEHAQVNHQQNRLSNNIYRDKHN